MYLVDFSQLFGEEDPDQDVSPDTEDPEIAGMLEFQSFRYLCRPHLGWRSTCCFTDVSVCVGVTPITKGPPAQISFGWHVFCSTGSFDFCYDPDIWAQGQSLRAFFCGNEIFHYFIESVIGILIKHGRKLHRHLGYM